MDFGVKCPDNLRLLGNGKTWKGFFFGIAIGTVFGFILFYLSQYQPLNATYYGVSFKITDPLIGFYLSTGALVGDLVKSFFKRRVGIKRGQPLFLIDQLDFVVGALIFAWAFLPFFIPWEEVIIILVITPFVHLFGNWVAFHIKKKKVWW